MASFKYKDVYIGDSYSIVGPYEAKSNLKKYDLSINDYYFGCKTFEQSEVKMQKLVLDYLLNKNDVNLVIGGDLSNQLCITSKTMSNYNIPFIGVYAACSTLTSSLAILANLVDSKKIKQGIVVTSSHNKVAERMFRYPIEYGAPKVKRCTYTSTGSIGFVVSRYKTNVRVESATIGSVVDMKIKDANNMGAVMAASAAESIHTHLEELKRDINYYDVILTGDLGVVGSNILKDYLLKKYNIRLKKHIDAGESLYKKSQNLYSGASGPLTVGLYLFSNILSNKKYKKILVVATGSLHSQISVNQKNTIPSISHVVSLEVSI